MLWRDATNNSDQELSLRGIAMQMLADQIRVHGPGGRAPRPLLIVDDDELELALIADRLGAAGYDVATAHNGDEARKMLSTGAYPVVITDYQMPVMDGLQFVEQMREAQDKSSYFIMWSIRAEEVDRDHGFSRGVDDYVSKQSPDAELLAHIETGFNTMQMRQSLLRGRTARRQAVMVESGADFDVWNSAASRLHAEILRARRYQRPLTVLTLHIERALTQPECDRLAPAQLQCLISAINATIRHGVDWVVPLDTAGGLARLLAVFPETSRSQAERIRQRISIALGEAAVTDEFAEMMPECSAGVASLDVWPENIAINAATLVAAAERRVEKLLPTMP
jgi:DNA-binding response OmpR family regulator